MTIKLLLLKSGEDLIADVQEMVVKENVVGYFLTRRCVFGLTSFRSSVYSKSAEGWWSTL